MNPRIGRAGPLSRERIVHAAIEVADESGLEGLTMKRVAERLDAGVMSLYRHVPDKEVLIGSMVERVTGQYAYPDQAGLAWREAMHALAERDWTALIEHPWMLSATASATPPFGAASLADMEWALTALQDLELPLPIAARVIMTINNYVQGSARVFLGERQSDSADPGRNWQQRLTGVALERFPLLGQLITEPLPDGERDWFAEGLDVILDGVESRSRPRGSGMA